MDDQKHQDFSTEGTTPVFSDAVPTGPSPVAPPAPVMLLPSGVNVVKKGSGWPKIKWGKGTKAMLAGSILALVLLVGGIFAATKLTKKPTNPPSKAWTGVTTNPEALPVPEPAKDNLPTQMESASSRMFGDLVLAFPAAEKQDINIISSKISGKAYLHYDKFVDKTYVFTRLENLSIPSGQVVRFWLSNIEKQYVSVGVGEFINENGKSVLHSVFVKDGNLKDTYKELTASYELSLQVDNPSTPFISLKF
ncbi:MAG: hypothetical protein AAB768_00665 [Patescibacteria group bacterium]